MRIMGLLAWLLFVVRYVVSGCCMGAGLVVLEFCREVF